MNKCHNVLVLVSLTVSSSLFGLYEGLSYITRSVDHEASPLEHVRARIMKVWQGLDLLCAVNLGTVDRESIAEHMYADALLCYHYLTMIKSVDVRDDEITREFLSIASIIAHTRMTYAEIFKYDNPLTTRAADSVFEQMVRYCVAISPHDISELLTMRYDEHTTWY